MLYAVLFLVYEKEKRADDMNLLYKSTRDAQHTVTASEAILKIGRAHV